MIFRIYGHKILVKIGKWVNLPKIGKSTYFWKISVNLLKIGQLQSLNWTFTAANRSNFVKSINKNLIKQQTIVFFHVTLFHVEMIFLIFPEFLAFH
jgi:hypothetical protein